MSPPSSKFLWPHPQNSRTWTWFTAKPSLSNSLPLQRWSSPSTDAASSRDHPSVRVGGAVNNSSGFLDPAPPVPLSSPSSRFPLPSDPHVPNSPSIKGKLAAMRGTILHVFFHTLQPLLLLLLSLSTAIWDAAEIPMLEAASCRNWYLLHDPSKVDAGRLVLESLCKIGPVQQEVATIRGVQLQFESLTSLMLAFPFAWLAKKTDKRKLLVLGSFGLGLRLLAVYGLYTGFVTAPLRLTWLAPLFSIIGGGPSIMFLYIWSMLAAATPDTERSSVFFVISSTQLAMQAIGTSFSAFLLQSSPWSATPFAVVVSLAMIPPLVLSLQRVGPEVATYRKYLDDDIEGSHQQSRDVESPTIPHTMDRAEADRSSRDNLLDRAEFLDMARPPSLELPFEALRKEISASDFPRHIYRHYLTDTVFQSYFLMCGLMVVGMESTMIIQQWASNTFGWRLSEATFLTAYYMIVSFVVLALLPVLNAWLATRSPPSIPFDLFLTQGNLVLRAAGAFAMGVAQIPSLFVPALTLFTLGAGLLDSEKSFLAGLVPGDSITEVYTLRMVVQSVAEIVAGYTWAALFRAQLSLGGLWRGLPFWVAGGLFLACLALSRRIQLALSSRKS